MAKMFDKVSADFLNAIKSVLETSPVSEELKGNQHKIDANKNGKVDAHDFKLLRKKKKVAEEAEQLDELSPELLARAHDKAADNAMAAYRRRKARGDTNPSNVEKKNDARMGKFAHGERLALRRDANKMSNEEFDNIEESYEELKRLKNNIERNEKRMKSIPGIHPEKKRLEIQIQKDTKKHKELFNRYWGKNEEDEKEEMKEGKRGLWDNIHAKRKRIKAGSGERMRKPGSKGAPTAADFRAASESVEIEEVKNLTGLPKSTAEKNKQYIEITHLLGHKSRVPVHPTNAYRALNHYRNDPTTKSARIVSEDLEQIDELSKKTLGSYVYKAANQVGEKGITAGLKIGDAEDSKKEFKTMGKRQKGIAKAVSKLTKEEQDFIDSLNAMEEAEQIDELSPATMGRYINKAKDHIDTVSWRQGHREGSGRNPSGPFEKKLTKRHKGIETAVKKLTREEAEQIDELSKKTLGSYVKKAAGSAAGVAAAAAGQAAITGKATDYDKRALRNRLKGVSKATDKLTKEEIELDEARGRPRKAAAKDFTVHPVTKEKLMHNNPEHMKRIEKLQKTGALEKPKTEAGQHIINQLRKAAVSMTGGATVHFTHGESKNVSAKHAQMALDKYVSMRPSEKEDFQKKISHSHEHMMKHL